MDYIYIFLRNNESINFQFPSVGSNHQLSKLQSHYRIHWTTKHLLEIKSLLINYFLKKYIYNPFKIKKKYIYIV